MTVDWNVLPVFYLFSIFRYVLFFIAVFKTLNHVQTIFFFFQFHRFLFERNASSTIIMCDFLWIEQFHKSEHEYVVLSCIFSDYLFTFLLKHIIFACLFIYFSIPIVLDFQNKQKIRNNNNKQRMNSNKKTNWLFWFVLPSL